MAVTRARPQASALAARLRELGADVVEAPAIRTQPLDAELPELAGFDLLCVTSPAGVDALFDRLDASGRDARALAGTTVAAIGPGTARALAEHGVRADVVPERAVAEGLVEALAGTTVERALIVRAREGRDVLPDALRERGADVEVVALYETVAEPLDPETAAAAARADYVTFTSASTVRFFLAAAGTLDGPRIASIGPATSAALREAGLEPHLEADPHTPDGLVAALAGRRPNLKRSDPISLSRLRRPGPMLRGVRPVTFLSDYGTADEFVGVVHAVIARIAPDARVIDISHGIQRQDVLQGALMLARTLPYAPAGVHLAVVDPEVGARRRAIALRTADEDRLLVGPDNGLLLPASERFGGIVEAVEISASPWRLEPVAATFHGRDLFAPVAARLASGAPLAEAGRRSSRSNSCRWRCRARGARRARSWRPWSASTCSATSRCSLGTATSPRRGSASATP